MVDISLSDIDSWLGLFSRVERIYEHGKRIYEYMREGYETPFRSQLRIIINELADPKILYGDIKENFYKNMIPEAIRRKQGFFYIFQNRENEELLINFISKMLEHGDFEICKVELKEDYEKLYDFFGKEGFELHLFDSYMNSIASYICFRLMDLFTAGDEIILRRLTDIENILCQRNLYPVDGDFFRQKELEEFVLSICSRYSRFKTLMNAVCLFKKEKIRKILYGFIQNDAIQEQDAYECFFSFVEKEDDFYIIYKKIMSIFAAQGEARLETDFQQDVVYLLWLLLVLKNLRFDFDSSVTLIYDRTKCVSCDYYDSSYIDLDAMMSQIFDKKFEPFMTSTYYKQINSIESGFSEKMRDDIDYNSVLQAFVNARYVIDDMDSNSLETREFLLEDINEALSEKLRFFVVTERCSDYEISMLAQIFPDMIYIRKERLCNSVYIKDIINVKRVLRAMNKYIKNDNEGGYV